MNADQLAILALDQQGLRRQSGSIRRMAAALDFRLGAQARHLIATAKAAMPFTIQQTADATLRGNQIRSHAILKRHSVITGDRLLELQSLILEPANLLGPSLREHRPPDVAIRFMSSTELPVLFDLVTGGMWVRKHDGGAGGPDAWFTPAARLFVELLSPYRIDSSVDD